MERITQLSRAGVKDLARLGRKEHRRETGRFLVEGVRLVGEALRSGFEVEWCLVEAAKVDAYREIIDSAKARGSNVASISGRDLSRLTETVTPQGIAFVLVGRPWTLEAVVSMPGATVVLDGVSDPANVGGILRSGWAFGLGGAILLAGSAEVTNPKTLRASMGGALHLPLVEGVSASEAILAVKGAGHELVGAICRGGEPAAPASWRPRTALVLGSEAGGLSEELVRACDRLVSIEQDPRAESLNVVVSAGILLYLHHVLTGGYADPSPPVTRI